MSIILYITKAFKISSYSAVLATLKTTLNTGANESKSIVKRKLVDATFKKYK